MEQNLPDASDLYRKARDLMDENKFEDAVILFQKSVELDPHFKTLELLGESYIRLNRFSDAIIPLAASVSLNKGVRAASLLAEVFVKLKNYSAAKDMAEIALSREPNNRKALEVMKIVAEISGNNSDERNI
jgi:tetratricopeptide (TPR) repeat protein